MNKFPLKRRVLIVGEGRETEYNYFVGFRNEFQALLDDTATSVKVARGNGGNAQNIVKNAIEEARKFRPERKHGDRVFLLLDTEGTGREPGQGRMPELKAAEKLAASKNIEIVYSCPSFEYWLLCHFKSIPRRTFKDCDEVIAELDKNKRWNSVSKIKYNKSDQDIFARLSSLFDVACVQAMEIDTHYLKTNKIARRANPSTQVYELIAILIGEMTDKKCPIGGNWKLVGNPAVTIQLKKGDLMPSHEDKPVRWQL